MVRSFGTGQVCCLKCFRQGSARPERKLLEQTHAPQGVKHIAVSTGRPLGSTVDPAICAGTAPAEVKRDIAA